MPLLNIQGGQFVEGELPLQPVYEIGPLLHALIKDLRRLAILAVKQVLEEVEGPFSLADSHALKNDLGDPGFEHYLKSFMPPLSEQHMSQHDQVNLVPEARHLAPNELKERAVTDKYAED